MDKPRYYAGGQIPPWIDADDVEQVEALARLEAESLGFDPEDAAREARNEYVSAERKRNHRECPASNIFREKDVRNGGFTEPSLAWLSDARKVVGLSPPKRQTDGQRKRFLRNQVIFAATMAGFSQRNLGRAFDLPHSRISAIVDEMKAKTGRG